MSWQDKVILLAGEVIKRGQRKEKGHLGQTEIISFTIVNNKGRLLEVVSIQSILILED
ncbi:hypothetical protein BANRA_00463 [Acinetobacter baumannii]|nr:hypothetical protein BANRA_01411 [Acinetobacter baumannii]VCY86990.1 hypothetical protein BANRA_00463 [Acinetobacter baumannii]